MFRDRTRLNITAVDIESVCSKIGRGSISLLWTKVFLFGTPQTHPGKLVFDQFSSTADPLFGRSKNFIQKITQLCIYRFRYVLCICPKYVFMQVNTMYIYYIY